MPTGWPLKVSCQSDLFKSMITVPTTVLRKGEVLTRLPKRKPCAWLITQHVSHSAAQAARNGNQDMLCTGCQERDRSYDRVGEVYTRRQ